MKTETPDDIALDESPATEPAAATNVVEGQFGAAVARDQAAQRWAPGAGDRCPATKDGVQCGLIAYHDASMNSTPHLFDIAAHETTGAWTCGECGEFCNPTTYAAGVPVEKCWKCGAPAPAWEPTPVDPAAVARDFDPQQVENIERQANGLPPLPIRGTGKNFDMEGAWADLHAISIEVEANAREVDELTKKRKAAVSRYEDAQGRFKHMFDHYFEAKQKADEQPGLDLQPAGGCPIARELGAPCPACLSALAKFPKGDVPVDDPLHADHEQHADVARSLLVKDRDELLATLRKKNLYLDAAEFAGLPVGDLQVLQRFAAQTGVVPPPLLAHAHIAATAGSDRQECKRCGLQLWGPADIAAGADAYPALVMVGLDCPGSLAESVNEALKATADEGSATATAEDVPADEDSDPPAEDEAVAAQPRKAKKKAKK